MGRRFWIRPDNECQPTPLPFTYTHMHARTHAHFFYEMFQYSETTSIPSPPPFLPNAARNDFRSPLGHIREL